MEISVPYGTSTKQIRVPPEVRIDVLAPKTPKPIDDLQQAFLRACRKPVGTEPLESMLSSDSQVVVLVSDLTRSRGTVGLLPICIRYLRGRGVGAASIRVIVARGAHRGLSTEEKRMFDSDALSGVVVEEHDCDDPSKLSALLLTRRGTPVRTHVAIKDADVVVLLSPVSFHYFAGFGGARKLILPGCADRTAIVANHRLSLMDTIPVTLHPSCRPGHLEGNPVHEDMIEALEALHGVFAINFFCDGTGGVIFVNAGDPVRSHQAACDAYRDVYLLAVDDPYSIAILSAGGKPNDLNLLQSHKALRHVVGAVRQGGSILFFAECNEGVGSPSLESALRMKRDDFLKSAYHDYALNNQTAVSLHDLTQRFEVAMVSATNVDVLLSTRIKPCVNVEAFLAESVEKHGANRIAVISQGASVLLEHRTGGSG